ncbi:MAG: hypothetical protein SF053_03840 [Bacteroidia bacterium]|nr:hypothetical protein [Bacteroidia bacterium]
MQKLERLGRFSSETIAGHYAEMLRNEGITCVTALHREDDQTRYWVLRVPLEDLRDAQILLDRRTHGPEPEIAGEGMRILGLVCMLCAVVLGLTQVSIDVTFFRILVAGLAFAGGWLMLRGLRSASVG